MKLGCNSQETNSQETNSQETNSQVLDRCISEIQMRLFPTQVARISLFPIRSPHLQTESSWHLLQPIRCLESS